MRAFVCPLCKGTGRILLGIEFDGKVWRDCPACTPPNPERARMAREFGTDRQRREIAQRRTGRA